MNRTRALEWLRRREVDEEEEDERQAEEGARRRGGGDEDAPGAMTPLHCAAATGAVRAVQLFLAPEATALLSNDESRLERGLDGRGRAHRRGRDARRRGRRRGVAREPRARWREPRRGRVGRRTEREGTRAGSGEVEFFAAGVAAQRARVMEWAVAPGERGERGVPRAAWSALDARAELTRRADLGDFLQRLVDDEDFQADMENSPSAAGGGGGDRKLSQRAAVEGRRHGHGRAQQVQARAEVLQGGWG